jgi:general secretion pathway protein D
MSDRNIDRVTKIPVLGDIPLIGFFFRNTTKTVQKSNILIALTAYVVTDQGDLRRILEKKMKERREFIERFSARDDRRDPSTERSYSSKRGMLAEINRAVRDAEEEEREIEQVRLRDAVEGEPIDLPPTYKPPGTEAPAQGAKLPQVM